jgi:ATP-dependent Clp protease ATP-binding subunit ClpC
VSISKADIAKVISGMTGIRLGEIEGDEQHRLKTLEVSLKKRIVGQDGAISSVSGAIRSARVELRQPNRPKAVFIFAGPSGVGKTELAKALSAELFGSDDALIQLNMSEFMEPHSVSKLIGAPAGYIGHDKEGQLTSVLRRKPDCIVLLDEFEKADAQVANLFLQLFDEGRITDAQGHVVNARNALFILTCNLGADGASESGMGFQRAISEDAESYRKKVAAQVRKHFPTEFINRVDEIIVFDHLGKEQIREIANREIELLTAQLKTERSITVTFEEAAINHLVEKGYDRAYGARALLRVIDDNVRKPLSNLIVSESPSVVTVTMGEEGIQLLTEEVKESPERIEE